MNDFVKNEYLNGIAIEDMDTHIYDLKINGITTIEDAKILADQCKQEMIEQGYQIETKILANREYHFFVSKNLENL